MDVKEKWKKKIQVIILIVMMIFGLSSIIPEDIYAAILGTAGSMTGEVFSEDLHNITDSWDRRT